MRPHLRPRPEDQTHFLFVGGPYHGKYKAVEHPHQIYRFFAYEPPAFWAAAPSMDVSDRFGEYVLEQIVTTGGQSAWMYHVASVSDMSDVLDAMMKAFMPQDDYETAPP